MIKSLHPLRLFLAAVIAVPWPSLPVFAEEPATPTPPVTDEAARAAAYTPANFATEFAARPGTSNFERAFGFIPHLASLPPGPMRDRQQALFLEQMSSRFTGDTAFNASELLARATDPAAQRTLAMLYAAAQDPQVHARLMEQYNAAKAAAGGTLDFATFLTAMQTTIREATPGSLTSLDRIIMGDAAPRPPAPQRPGDPSGDGPGPGGPRGGTDFARTHWNPAEIYGQLGDPNVREVGGRTLAYNMAFLTDETGQIVPTLVVADITNTSNIQAFNIPLHASKDQGPVQFTLGGKSYSVSLNAAGSDVSIVFPGAPGLPSAGALMRMAAEKVKANGYIVDVGGKEFFLGGQGYAGGGGNSFWTREMLNNLTNPNFNPLDFKPEMAAASVRMEGGQPVPIPQSSIGQVNGKWYDMVWNPQARGGRGEFEVKEGLPPSRGPGAGPGAETGPWRDLTSVGITPGTGGATDSPQAQAAFNLNRQLASTVTGARIVWSEGGREGGIDRGFWLMTKRDGSSFVRLDVGPNPDASRISVLALDGSANNRHWLAVTTPEGVGFADLRKPVAPGFASPGGQTATNAFTPTVAGGAPNQMKAVTDPELARYLMTQRMGITSEQMDRLISNVSAYTRGNTNYAFHGTAARIMVGYLNQTELWEVHPGNAAVTNLGTGTAPAGTPVLTNGSLGAVPNPVSDASAATAVGGYIMVRPPGATADVRATSTVAAPTAANPNRIYHVNSGGTDYYYLLARMPGGGQFNPVLVFSSNPSATQRETLPANIVYPTTGEGSIPAATAMPSGAGVTWELRRFPVGTTGGAIGVYRRPGPGSAGDNFVGIYAHWGIPGDAAAQLAAARGAARTP